MAVAVRRDRKRQKNPERTALSKFEATSFQWLGQTSDRLEPNISLTEGDCQAFRVLRSGFWDLESACLTLGSG